MGTSCLNNSVEEKERKQLLLSSILHGIIFLSLIATIVNLFAGGYKYDSLFDFLPCLTLGIFLFLNGLVKRGIILLPSLILVSLLSCLSYYLIHNWGTTVPQSWTVLILTVIISETIITSRFSLLLIIIHSFIYLFITYKQINKELSYRWWDISPSYGSVIVMLTISYLVFLISWLSNREIEKALKRAKESELNLKKERDHLEFEVEKRTKELKKIQIERITNLYKFADFGRMTVGLFHDIANPLTQVSLSLTNIEYQTKNKISSEFNKIDPIVKRAIKGTKQMERLIVSVRKQVQQQETRGVYKPWTEIKTVIENFEYRAREMRVQFSMIGEKEIHTFGNSIRFYQLASNLISNALDSYYEVKKEENRKIIIGLDTNKKEIILTVKDFGCGISEEIMEKIFDPLFTTKDTKRGSGVGLYISKNIVEKEFKGQIKVKSKLNEGTLFTIKFPILKKSDEK